MGVKIETNQNILAELDILAKQQNEHITKNIELNELYAREIEKINNERTRLLRSKEIDIKEIKKLDEQKNILNNNVNNLTQQNEELNATLQNYQNRQEIAKNELRTLDGSINKLNSDIANMTSKYEETYFKLPGIKKVLVQFLKDNGINEDDRYNSKSNRAGNLKLREMSKQDIVNLFTYRGFTIKDIKGRLRNDDNDDEEVKQEVKQGERKVLKFIPEQEDNPNDEIELNNYIMNISNTTEIIDEVNDRDIYNQKEIEWMNNTAEYMLTHTFKPSENMSDEDIRKLKNIASIRFKVSTHGTPSDIKSRIAYKMALMKMNGIAIPKVPII